MVTKFVKLRAKTYSYLKSDSHLPKKNCVICFIETPVKLMENTIYFILKALFVLKIFTFLSMKKGLIRNKVNFKIYDVTTWITSNYNTHIAKYLIK